MKRKLLACSCLIFSSFYGTAQLSDNFNDGNFSDDPAWAGNIVSWIVNASFQLQSNDVAANSSYYLSTASTKATNAQWEFYTQLAFNPSSVNYTDVFLIASAEDVIQSSTTGYFIRIGGVADEISLFRKDAGSITKIIDGTDAVLNSSNNFIHIKVIRNAANVWTLNQQTNTLPDIAEGTVFDDLYLTSSFFGIFVRQSTAGFFQKHFFDDIRISEYVPDIIPPAIQSVTAVNSTTLNVLFNEPVDESSSGSSGNYVIASGSGFPVSAARDDINHALVQLTFAENFPVNTNTELVINAVEDLSGNAISHAPANFTYVVPHQYDIVIDELMADPDPPVLLPGAEWLELKNTSGYEINLFGWTLAKLTDNSGPITSYVLKPDSFLIVCAVNNAVALSAFGATVSVSNFPALGNSGDLIYLVAPQGQVIHALNYTDSWYQNRLKQEGGWSLEMIDPHNPCEGSTNWKATTDPAGGTPGRRNVEDAINPDQQGPALLRTYSTVLTGNSNMVLVFDEGLDSSKAARISNYFISDGIGTPLSAVPVGPLFDRVRLTLPVALLPGKVYSATVTGNLSDCSGNRISMKNTARAGLSSSSVDSFDIVINEILFNPSPLSNDYVELYNRSNKILNLKNISIANATQFEQLTTEDYLFFPGDFIVITESRELVLHDYVAKDPGAFIQVQMPSYNDDAGEVWILNEQGNIVDQVDYLDDWHFKLLTNYESVALERIDYNAASQNPENWHSAASAINYGTPTYKNSQYRTDAGIPGNISVEPSIFSPDNDGRDDVATINYNFPEPGYVANIVIYDAIGRLIKNLQRNALCGIKGYYRWTGLDEKNQPLPAGIYIIYTEIINLRGKTKSFKNTIVLAKK